MKLFGYRYAGKAAVITIDDKDDTVRVFVAESANHQASGPINDLPIGHTLTDGSLKRMGGHEEAALAGAIEMLIEDLKKRK